MISSRSFRNAQICRNPIFFCAGTLSYHREQSRCRVDSQLFDEHLLRCFVVQGMSFSASSGAPSRYLVGPSLERPMTTWRPQRNGP